MSRKEEGGQQPLGRVVPAHLDYLTIYNPAFGATEATESDQILFYYSEPRPNRSRSVRRHGPKGASPSHDINRQLRHIGLAQGMVNLARGFSDDKAVDSVETEKRRIVLKELEPGWWVLASVNLTVLPSSRNTATDSETDAPSVEYSGREVSPPALLLRQLSSAYRIFLLHHGSSFEKIYKRVRRPRFCEMLANFWSRFARDWDVLLHGNPAAEIYGGLRLAAGGELGIGVGEEDWGSGERDVLEGLIKGTEGLNDLMVFRFGDGSKDVVGNERKGHAKSKAHPPPDKWLGNYSEPKASDGAIFTGLGTISPVSQTAISDWARSIYFYGEEAYGVKENPAAYRRPTRQDTRQTQERSPQDAPRGSPEDRHRSQSAVKKTSSEPRIEEPKKSYTGPSIPPPIVSAAEESLRNASAAVEVSKSRDNSQPLLSTSFGETISNPENWVKVLTLGYGNPWQREAHSKGSETGKDTAGDAMVSSDDSAKVDGEKTANDKDSMIVKNGGKSLHAPDATTPVGTRPRIERKGSSGQFLIGLKGDLADVPFPDEETDVDSEEWSNRLSVRTLHVGVYEAGQAGLRTETMTVSSDETVRPASNGERRIGIHAVKVSVYVHRPFIYILLFDRQAASPTLPSFFRVLHHHLKPMHKPLISSTSPLNVASRIRSSLSTALASSTADSPIYELLFNPVSLHVHTSIPDIPWPSQLANDNDENSLVSPPWSRVEALSVHSQILNDAIETRGNFYEQERQSKTSRNWWVVWMRMSASVQEATTGATYHEATIVRRAGEYSRSPRKSSSNRATGSPSRGGAFQGFPAMPKFMRIGAKAGPSAETKTEDTEVEARREETYSEGLGIDPRRYIENLLSLNR